MATTDSAAGQPRNRRRVAWHVAMLAPIVIYFALFFVLPVARLLLLSVWDSGPTIAPFLEIFGHKEYLGIILTTAKLSVGVTALTLLLGFPVAIYLARLSGWALALGMFLVVFPLLTSVLVRSFAWMTILGRQGVINEMLIVLGLTAQPLKLLYNQFGIYVGMVHVLLPIAVVTMYGVVKGIDTHILKAAAVLGAPPVQVFLRVFLPLSAPGITAAGLLVFIASASAYITPVLLGGSGHTMIAALIGDQIQETLNWPLGAAMSVILLVVSMLAFTYYFRFTQGAGAPLSGA
jgi:ABC-type spermidine/putrescine transport system permease subunit I